MIMKNILAIILFFLNCSLFAQSEKMVVSTVGTDTFRVALPQFPGGDSAMFSFINQHVAIKTIVQNRVVHDTVYAGFQVAADGSLSDIHVMPERKLDAEIDSAVLHAIQVFPIWKPGTCNGNFQIVNVSISLRIHLDSGDAQHFVFSSENSTIFYEVMPIYPGGDAAFAQYISSNVRYPSRERKKGIEGTVYVYFIVGKDGNISGVKSVRNVPNGPGLTEEAIRVISTMPKWTPGFMNGRPVKVSMTVPIRFVL